MDHALTRASALAAAIVFLTVLPTAAQMENLQCFKVKSPLKLKGLADIDAASLPAIGPECKIKGPKFYCTSADMTVLEAEDKKTKQTLPATALPGPVPGDRVCYAVSCKQELPEGVFVEDRFGQQSLTKLKAKLLCVPAIEGLPCGASLPECGGACPFGESCRALIGVCSGGPANGQPCNPEVPGCTGGFCIGTGCVCRETEPVGPDFLSCLCGSMLTGGTAIVEGCVDAAGCFGSDAICADVCAGLGGTEAELNSCGVDFCAGAQPIVECADATAPTCGGTCTGSAGPGVEGTCVDSGRGSCVCQLPPPCSFTLDPVCGGACPSGQACQEDPFGGCICL